MPGRRPFNQPPNLAVITLHRILRGEAPILHVSHDEGDGGWQFLDGSPAPDINDAAVVGLHTVIELDPTLLELADLPVAWTAWRERADQPWKRHPSSAVR